MSDSTATPIPTISSLLPRTITLVVVDIPQESGEAWTSDSASFDLPDACFDS